MNEAVAPGDIYPEAGARVPLPRREDLDAEAVKLFDHFVDPEGNSYVGLKGPGGVRLHSPTLAVRLQHMSHYIRYEAGITTREREVTVLATAREFDNQFEWCAHEGPARRAGVPEGTIEAIRRRGPLDGAEHADAVLVRLVRETFGDKKVAKQTYADAVALHGVRKLIDIVGLMGNYAATAAILTVFDVQLHEGQEPLLPPR